MVPCPLCGGMFDGRWRGTYVIVSEDDRAVLDLYRRIRDYALSPAPVLWKHARGFGMGLVVCPDCAPRARQLNGHRRGSAA